MNEGRKGLKKQYKENELMKGKKYDTKPLLSALFIRLD